MAKDDHTDKWATHTATLVVQEGATGRQKTRSTRVRVLPSRIEDEYGRFYSRESGRQTGPKRMMGYGSTYIHRILPESLSPVSSAK